MFGVPVMGALKLEWDRRRVMSSWGKLSLSSRRCVDMWDQERERGHSHVSRWYRNPKEKSELSARSSQRQEAIGDLELPEGCARCLELPFLIGFPATSSRRS